MATGPPATRRLGDAHPPTVDRAPMGTFTPQGQADDETPTEVISAGPGSYRPSPRTFETLLKMGGSARSVRR